MIKLRRLTLSDRPSPFAEQNSSELSSLAQITSSAVTATTFAVASSTSPCSTGRSDHSQTRQVHRVAGYPGPHCLRRTIALHEDCDTAGNFRNP